MSISITKDTSVREKYRGTKARHRKTWDKKKRKSKSQVEELALHGTAGGNTIIDLLKWMVDGERAKEYWKSWALFHFAIGKMGNITEVIDPEYFTYHSSSSNHDKKTIGIELINSSKSNRDPYTDKQYEAIANLFKKLLREYPNLSRIVSHNYNGTKYSKRPKDCPGKGFDWVAFSKILGQNGLAFSYNKTKDKEFIYNIERK